MMNVPDDFVFVCDTRSKCLVLASDVVKIFVRVGDSHPTSYIALQGSEAFVIINIDHGHGQEEFKKGTKEFNELLELACMKKVLK